MSSRADGFNLVLFVPEQLDLFERNNGFALEAAAGFGNVAWWQVTEMHNVVLGCRSFPTLRKKFLILGLVNVG
jgi:hypothetical protein